MKRSFAAAILIAGLLLIVGGYEFLEDSRLGGMPRKEIDIAVKSNCPIAISDVLTHFASRRGFELSTGQSAVYDRQKLTETNDDFDLSRWNANVIVSQYHQGCGDHLLCYTVYIEYKGWLWWTKLADADQLSDDLVSSSKSSSCVERATVILTTKPLG